MAGTKTRAFAIIFSFFLVIFSLLYGPYRSLSNLSHNATSVFFQKEGASPYNAVVNNKTSALNMLSLLKKENHPSNSVVEKVQSATKDLDMEIEKKNIDGILIKNKELTKSLYDLYNELSTNTDFSYVNLSTADGILADVDKQDNIIKFNDYNNKAVKYNKALESFPANIFSIVFHFEKLVTV